MKVKRAIKPCHNPIQNPAGSRLNFSFPGAHEFINTIMIIKPKTRYRCLIFFMKVKFRLKTLPKLTKTIKQKIHPMRMDFKKYSSVQRLVLIFHYCNAFNLIVCLDLINHINTFNHFSKTSVVSVEVSSIISAVADKKL